MIDNAKMSRVEYEPESGELRSVCDTLHQAADIISTADRTPDESVKKPLLEGAKTMLQNVIAAIEGRRTDGLVEPIPDDDDE